jgi:hypothetical protein
MNGKHAEGLAHGMFEDAVPVFSFIRKKLNADDFPNTNTPRHFSLAL